VIIGVLVVSVALNLPGWLLTELIAWKDRHEISSPDFYGSYVFVYLRAYGVSSGEKQSNIIFNEYSITENIINVL